MAEQRVPDLEEMDEQEAQHFLAELFSRLSIEAEYQIRHEDYTTEWPQSGERLRGREKMRKFQEAHAGSRPPRRLHRMLVRDGLWVVEGVIDYGGGREVDFVLILELRDGKVFRETRYYAEPFEASESRAQWFEQMQR
jgi:SnoaL-like domain